MGIPALSLPGSQEDKCQFPGVPVKAGLKLQAAGPLPLGTLGRLYKAPLGAGGMPSPGVLIWPVFNLVFTASPFVYAVILCHVVACFTSDFWGR